MRPTAAAKFRWRIIRNTGITPKTIVKSVAEILEISSRDTIDKKGRRLSDQEKQKTDQGLYCRDEAGCQAA